MNTSFGLHSRALMNVSFDMGTASVHTPNQPQCGWVFWHLRTTTAEGRGKKRKPPVRENPGLFLHHYHYVPVVHAHSNFVGGCVCSGCRQHLVNVYVSGGAGGLAITQ